MDSIVVDGGRKIRAFLFERCYIFGKTGDVRKLGKTRFPYNNHSTKLKFTKIDPRVLIGK